VRKDTNAFVFVGFDGVIQLAQSAQACQFTPSDYLIDPISILTAISRREKKVVNIYNCPNIIHLSSYFSTFV
jgi:hypothetical protein